MAKVMDVAALSAYQDAYENVVAIRSERGALANLGEKRPQE